MPKSPGKLKLLAKALRAPESLKQPDWTQVNRHEAAAVPNSAQRDLVRDAAGGGAYAFFNHRAGFGAEERFDPGQFSALDLFWDPSREQVNLGLISKVRSLEPGQTAGYAFEVDYLNEAPQPGKEP